MKRLKCWWSGHVYIVCDTVSFTPGAYIVVCLRCLTNHVHYPTLEEAKSGG